MSEVHYDSKTKMFGGFPKIKKLGSVSYNGESSPFVWGNRLMRLELDDATNGVDSDYKTSAVIRDRETSEVISRLAEECYYYSFYQENGTAYILGTKDVHFENSTYHIELQPRAWLLARFKYAEEN